MHIHTNHLSHSRKHYITLTCFIKNHSIGVAKGAIFDLFWISEWPFVGLSSAHFENDKGINWHEGNFCGLVFKLWQSE